MELADLVFTTRETINRFENGNKTPNLNSLVEIANALEISVDDILIDSLGHPSSLVNSELYLLLSDIPENQREILTKLIKDIKNALDELKI